MTSQPPKGDFKTYSLKLFNKPDSFFYNSHKSYSYSLKPPFGVGGSHYILILEI